jgi:hypothetical protein
MVDLDLDGRILLGCVFKKAWCEVVGCYQYGDEPLGSVRRGDYLTTGGAVGFPRTVPWGSP